MQKIFSLFFCLGILAACSKHHELKKVTWTGAGPAPKINEKEFSITSYSKITDENLSLGYQRIAGAKVEGSFYKKIQTPEINLKLSSSGKSFVKSDPSTEKMQDSFIAASFYQDWDKSLESEIRRMRGLVSTVVPAVQREQKRFRNYFYESQPEVIVVNVKGVLTPMYELVYFNKEGAAFSLRVTKDFKFYSEKHEGTSFADAIALVFPEGPKYSDLMEVPLRRLIGDGTLQNDHVEVSTASTSTIKQNDDNFKFQPPDEKFDQVQVFFFVNKAFDWYKNTLGVELNRKLKVITHFGYPSKENSMFYFNGTVRLGTGDDESYSKIPLDPSIVIHEATHALVDELTQMPYEDEAGSLNEAYADFFACGLLKSALLGDVAYKKGPYKRNLVNNLKLSDKNGAKYHDSGIVSGTLWEMRDKLGEEKTFKLAIQVLTRLHPQSDFADFKNNLLLNVQKLSLEDQQKVESTLVTRGWK